MRTSVLLGAATALFMSAPVFAQETVVTINLIDKDAVGEEIGTVTINEEGEAITLQPDLTSVPPGEHGFHVHQNPDCGPAEREGEQVAGLAAGGHYDPADTGKHLGPQQEGGHLGDLPVLVVDESGKASEAVSAPRLSMQDVQGRSLMIHAGGDNYSDEPKPLGGGGARIACGVVK